MRIRRRFIIERAILPARTPRRPVRPAHVATLKTARLRARFAKLITALEFQRRRK